MSWNSGMRCILFTLTLPTLHSLFKRKDEALLRSGVIRKVCHTKIYPPALLHKIGWKTTPTPTPSIAWHTLRMTPQYAWRIGLTCRPQFEEMFHFYVKFVRRVSSVRVYKLLVWGSHFMRFHVNQKSDNEFAWLQSW